MDRCERSIADPVQNKCAAEVYDTFHTQCVIRQCRKDKAKPGKKDVGDIKRSEKYCEVHKRLLAKGFPVKDYMPARGVTVAPNEGVAKDITEIDDIVVNSKIDALEQVQRLEHELQEERKVKPKGKKSKKSSNYEEPEEDLVSVLESKLEHERKDMIALTRRAQKAEDELDIANRDLDEIKEALKQTNERLKKAEADLEFDKKILAKLRPLVQKYIPAEELLDEDEERRQRKSKQKKKR